MTSSLKFITFLGIWPILLLVVQAAIKCPLKTNNDHNCLKSSNSPQARTDATLEKVKKVCSGDAGVFQYVIQNAIPRSPFKKDYVKFMKLGSGGFATVYKAFATEKHSQEHQPVAIKEINLNVLLNMGDKTAFLLLVDEIDVMIKLGKRLPGMPHFINLYYQEPYLFIVMDYVDGVTLHELVDERPELMTNEYIAEIGLQLVRILKFLHEFEFTSHDGSVYPGIMHRDLKLDNVMVEPARESEILYGPQKEDNGSDQKQYKCEFLEYFEECNNVMVELERKSEILYEPQKEDSGSDQNQYKCEFLDYFEEVSIIENPDNTGDSQVQGNFLLGIDSDSAINKVRQKPHDPVETGSKNDDDTSSTESSDSQSEFQEGIESNNSQYTDEHNHSEKEDSDDDANEEWLGGDEYNSEMDGNYISAPIIHPSIHQDMPCVFFDENGLTLPIIPTSPPVMASEGFFLAISAEKYARLCEFELEKPFRVKLVDFGLAAPERFFNWQGSTGAVQAPEASGIIGVKKQLDIFLFGALLYCMWTKKDHLTRQTRKEKEIVQELHWTKEEHAAVPKSWILLIDACTLKDKANRPTLERIEKALTFLAGNVDALYPEYNPSSIGPKNPTQILLEILSIKERKSE